MIDTTGADIRVSHIVGYFLNRDHQMFDWLLKDMTQGYKLWATIEAYKLINAQTHDGENFIQWIKDWM
jgi:hypothetical protein